MSYTYYAPITIQNSKVAADHANFPILVEGTFDGTGVEADLRVVGSGGNIQNTGNGGISGTYTVPEDFVFSPNTDGSSPYSFEISRYNATTGEIIAWVKIPLMDASANLTIYMVYGDIAVTTSQEDIAGTWNAAFKAVWHCQEASSPLLDSSGGGHSFTTSLGSPNFQQAGTIGYAVNLIPIERFTAPHGTWLATTNLTLEVLVKPDVIDRLGRLFYHGDGTTNDGFFLTKYDSASGQWGFAYLVNPSSVSCLSNSAPSGGWQHVVGIKNDASVSKLYVDGVAQTDTETLSGAIDSTDPAYFGARSGGDQGFDGKFQEIRYSNVARSANWVLTTKNSFDSSTFLTFGAEAVFGGEVIGVESMFMAMNF